MAGEQTDKPLDAALRGLELDNVPLQYGADGFTTFPGKTGEQANTEPGTEIHRRRIVLGGAATNAAA